MKQRSVGLGHAGLVLALCLGFVAWLAMTPDHVRAQQVGSRSSAPAAVNYEAIAQNLVTQSAGVREGDLVLITGGVRDLELLEDIAVNVRKAGAFPLIAIGSDRLALRMYEDVPAKYDAQTPEFARKLTEVIDVFINVDVNEDPKILGKIPAERLAAQAAAFAPINELALERGVRNVNLGNGMYPTAANAQLFGLPAQELARMFWGGVNADYARMQASGEAVRKVLEGGKELHITNPNGTDLKVRIQERPVLMSDGVISAEEAKRGGAAAQVWLPAGEVFLAPVPGTAEGKLVVARDFFQGREIRNLELTFKGGKVTSMRADAGLEPFKALYDATGAGKEDFAYVDFGLNPDVRVAPGSRFASFVPAGMVTVGIGGNTWAGGDNKVQFGTAYFLPGSTVKVDGKVIVEKGALEI
jgi:aminopeptidase